MEQKIAKLESSVLEFPTKKPFLKNPCLNYNYNQRTVLEK